ncbi:MAG: NFACT family protein [Lachnospiraceae bacterium]|nr:NFACT family protein [Lachnospiraceae bacterium]
MAFDGITISCLTRELNQTLAGGRISKIAQPETDELLLTIKTFQGQYRLMLSANPSLPLVCLTELNQPGPVTAPNFCMLLRKHIQNGRIVSVTQPGLERIIHIQVEHLDELGDLCRKTLVIELMGKYSNIIFLKDDNTIIDSIKHISGMISSVREVLPGREYFIPDTQKKTDPLTFDAGERMGELLSNSPMAAYKAIYSGFTGISPIMAQELCYEAGIDADLPANGLSKEQTNQLADCFGRMTDQIREGAFRPVIVYQGGVPKDYFVLPCALYPVSEQKSFDSISELLLAFYGEKNAADRIRQRSVSLRRVVQSALERNVKKYDLQKVQMKDTEKREKYRVYGELISAYGYSVPQGSKSFQAVNYYTNEEITIPLDPDIPVLDNAKKYFEKYAKLKRTYEALTELTAQGKAEIDYLQSVSAALDMAQCEEDLIQIREELLLTGHIRKSGENSRKRQKTVNKPWHYVSSDGYDIFVGKNNLQNDQLTFKEAQGNDWWFHAKNCPGSHVLVKTNGETDIPDATFEEAARLAAYYSKNRDQDKTEVDYVQKKHVKKPGGAKPGFVVYYTNYSMVVGTDISGILQVVR